MMYLWEPAMIRFMEDASEHTTYNDEIVRVMRPHLQKTDSVCDAGSGLAYLSDAMAPYVRQVTALDCNEEVLRHVQQRIERKQLTNVQTCRADILTHAPQEPYDVMAFCFFGQLEQILRAAGEQCNPETGRIFIITRNYDRHRFSVSQKPCSKGGADTMEEELNARHIPVVRTDLSLEFGQPLRSFADAVLFFRTYSRGDASLVTDSFVRSKIEQRDSGEFPYYLPHQREISVLQFASKDLHR